MENAFLRDFMKMRQSLGTPSGHSDTTKKGVNAMPKNNAPSDVSLATIIEKKPSSKVVLRYFKKKFGYSSSSDSD